MKRFPALAPLLLSSFLTLAPLAPAKDMAPEKAVAAKDGAGNDLPTQPGAHKGVPCLKNPQLTYDLYLPKAYAEKPQEKFPVLFISGPQGSPGFLKHESWADANGVVLVVINNSKNGDWKPIREAQEAVLESVGALRLHPCLRFATGFSGGGLASAYLAGHHPKEFSGVVLQCHSGFDVTKPPASIAFGLIGGLDDTTHPDSAVRDGASRARKAGHYVQEEHLKQGHGWAPADVVQRMLSNMLFYARMTHPKLPPAERKEAETLPDRLIAAATTEPEAGKACAMLAPLLEVSEFKMKPFFPKALDAWCAARVKQLSALGDEAAFEGYAEDLTFERFAKPTGKSKAAVEAFRKRLEGAASLKAEFVAMNEFRRLKDGYERDIARGNAKAIREWPARFGKFAAKHEGTLAGRRAATLGEKKS